MCSPSATEAADSWAWDLLVLPLVPADRPLAGLGELARRRGYSVVRQSYTRSRGALPETRHWTSSCVSTDCARRRVWDRFIATDFPRRRSGRSCARRRTG
jgi:hypothetical protein